MSGIYERIGGEIEVGSAGGPRNVGTAWLDSGGFVAIWSYGFLGPLIGQRFDASGAPVGDAFPVSDDPDAGNDAAVTQVEGGFVVTWATHGDPGGVDIVAQRFDSAGARVGGVIAVNTHFADEQSLPGIAPLAGGGFVIVWRDHDPASDGSATAMKAQVFDAAGEKSGAEILVNTSTQALQDYPNVAALASGGFVVVWEDRVGDGPNDTGLKAQMFDAAGQKVGAELAVHDPAPGPQHFPEVVGLAGGGFVVTWWDMSQSGSSGSGKVVRAQMFDTSGERVGGPIEVNTVPDFGYLTFARIAALSSGGFVIVWNGSDADGEGVNAQAFDAAGSRVGSELLVNTATAGEQTHADVTEMPTGGFAITWEDRGASAPGIRAQLFAPPWLDGSPAADTFTGTAGPDAWRGLGGNDIARLWQGGIDTAQGGDGNDVFLLGAALTGADRIDGGTGSDTLALQGDYALALTANLAGIETLALLPGNDARFGDSAGNVYGYDLATVDANVAAGRTLLVYFRDLRASEAVVFDGSAETDGAFSFQGGAGDDALTGGAGADRLDGGAGADLLDGGGGNDLYFVDSAGDQVVEAAGGGVDEVRTALGTVGGAADLYVLPAHVENFAGTAAGAQGVAGNALDNIIGTGAGNDLIVVDAGGDDAVHAGGGNDFLYFGGAFTAADIADGGAGTDNVALLGSYVLALGAASFAGIERLTVYSSGNAAAPNGYALTMHDANVAAGAELMIYAGSLMANEGLAVDGSAETDGRFNIRGGRGADTLTGGAGADILWGNSGADVLAGGAGGDIFEYYAAAESSAASPDRILDFAAGDRVNLGGIDADGDAANGDSRFAFLGAGAFTGQAGQLRVAQADGGWLVEADVDGDGAADLAILVLPAPGTILASSDFWL